MDGVACLAAEGHDGGGGELARLVVRGLEDRGAAHGGFGGGDYGEVTAGEAKEDFPRRVIRESVGELAKFAVGAAYMVAGTITSRSNEAGEMEDEK